MSLAFIIYLAGISSSISAAFAWTVVLLTVGYAIWWILKGFSVIENTKNPLPKPSKWIPILAFVCLVSSALTPDKQTIYTMIAASTVEDIVSSPKVQELGGKSLEVLNKAMDDYLSSVKPKATEDK